MFERPLHAAGTRRAACVSSTASRSFSSACLCAALWPQHVIERERRGDYLGKTVQVVPHITDAIQDWIHRVAHTPVDGKPGVPDVCVIELGGTVGDIESMPFIEALRQFCFRVGPDNLCIVHVSLVPIIGVVGEQKTKPTQHSVQVLRSLGLNPNILACRCQEPIEASVREKLVSSWGSWRAMGERARVGGADRKGWLVVAGVTRNRFFVRGVVATCRRCFARWSRRAC